MGSNPACRSDLSFSFVPVSCMRVEKEEEVGRGWVGFFPPGTESLLRGQGRSLVRLRTGSTTTSRP